MINRLKFVGWYVFYCIALLVGCAPRTIVQRTTEHVIEFRSEDPRPSLAHAWRATVLIGADYGDEPARIHSCGSGSLIAPNLVLTAAHVVGHGPKPSLMIAFPDGKQFAATVQKIDNDADLALLAFDGHAQVMPLSLSAESPALMSPVWNFGAPGCMPGYVSAGLWGAYDPSDATRSLSGGFLWPGMSGGPVVDASGDLVGVNDAVIVEPSTQTRIPQMGVLVDWRAIKAFLE